MTSYGVGLRQTREIRRLTALGLVSGAAGAVPFLLVLLAVPCALARVRLADLWEEGKDYRMEG